MKRMKNLMITGMIVLFTAPLLSSTPTNINVEEDIIVGRCEDYCTGYADGLEAAGDISGMDEWNAAREDCIDNSDYCKQ